MLTFPKQSFWVISFSLHYQEKTLNTLNEIKEEPCNSQQKYEKGGFGF